MPPLRACVGEVAQDRIQGVPDVQGANCRKGKSRFLQVVDRLRTEVQDDRPRRGGGPEFACGVQDALGTRELIFARRGPLKDWQQDLRGDREMSAPAIHQLSALAVRAETAGTVRAIRHAGPLIREVGCCRPKTVVLWPPKLLSVRCHT